MPSLEMLMIMKNKTKCLSKNYNKMQKHLKNGKKSIRTSVKETPVSRNFSLKQIDYKKEKTLKIFSLDWLRQSPSTTNAFRLITINLRKLMRILNQSIMLCHQWAVQEEAVWILIKFVIWTVRFEDSEIATEQMR